MEKSEFYRVVEKLILPLFTGSFIEGEEESYSRDSEVAFGKRNSLLIKPSKTDDYRLILKRGQPFQTFEINLLKSVLSELNKISLLNLEDESYISVLQDNAIEKSICAAVSDEETANSMFGILNYLEKTFLCSPFPIYFLRRCIRSCHHPRRHNWRACTNQAAEV